MVKDFGQTWNTHILSQSNSLLAGCPAYIELKLSRQTLNNYDESKNSEYDKHQGDVAGMTLDNISIIMMNLRTANMINI